MAYNNAIPQAGDRIADSQLPILDNFIAINAWMLPDHVGFNVPNAGKHDTVTFPERAGNPTTAADEVILFSKESAYTPGKTVLSYQNENIAAGAPGFIDIGDGGSAAGWSLISSGLLLKWGFLNWTTAMAQDTQFDIPFANSPNFSAITYANFHPLKSASSDLDAHVRYQAFIGGPQQVDVYVTKRTDGTKPTENFNFWYLIFGQAV